MSFELVGITQNLKLITHNLSRSSAFGEIISHAGQTGDYEQAAYDV
jgi:hypothetical protein